MSPFAAAGWTLLFWLIVPIALEVIDSASPGAMEDVVNQGACVALAASIVIFAVLRVHAPEASLRQTLGLRPLSPLHALLAVLASFGFYPGLCRLDEYIQARWPLSQEVHDSVEALYHPHTAAGRVGLAVMVLVVIPAAYELLFRGALFGEVERSSNAGVATIATTVCFAAVQDDPRNFPTFFALGLVLARLRDRTGTVAAPLLASLVLSGIDHLPVLRGRDPLVDAHFPVRWVVIGAVVGVVALLALGTGRRAENARADR